MKVETYSGIMGIAIVMAADGGCGSDDGGGGGGDDGGGGDSGQVDNPLCMLQHPLHSIKYIPDHFAPTRNLQWLSTVYRIKSSTYLSRVILKLLLFSLNHCSFPPWKCYDIVMHYSFC